jgi:ATP-dependent Zn protease
MIAFHEASDAIIQAIIESGDVSVHKAIIVPCRKSLGSAMFMFKKIFSVTPQSCLE